MDNVQNCDSYINMQSSQTYRSYIVTNPCTIYSSHNYTKLSLLFFKYILHGGYETYSKNVIKGCTVRSYQLYSLMLSEETVQLLEIYLITKSRLCLRN
jgi:hypothetical protein